MFTVGNQENREQEIDVMKQIKKVEVKTDSQFEVGSVRVFVSQSSHESVRMEVNHGVLDEIFVPKRQTHQVFVARGRVILVVWENQKPKDIHLDETMNQVVIIPPNVRYGFVNTHQEPSVVINAVVHDQGSNYQLEHYSVDPIVYESVAEEQPMVANSEQVVSEVVH